MSTSSSTSRDWPVTQYTPRHRTWPYTDADFRRQDPSNDSNFYSAPRFVTHIDDMAIASLREYYGTVLPTAKGSRILDFCSSWISHYPRTIEDKVEAGDVTVVGLGMNARELDANDVLKKGGWGVVDLNVKPSIRDALSEAGIATENLLFDASTNVVSTDYLTQPVAVLKSLLEVTKPGGTVHLAISNRCFPTKAIARWLRVSEGERVQMVGDFLWFAGWRGIEIVEVSDGTVKQEGNGQGGGEGEDGLRGFMRMMGMGSGRRDPLWVVRGVKEG
ncbi:putative S-adenosyl-L-methionine-dependent methyltransferase [Septoria linicola]|nr:putative S-adenosyl-L-methionine-dependent methyltransferase [Septoria linicola]